MAPTQDTSAFDSKYVSTNIRAGAPPYSPELVRKLRNELCELDREEFEYLSYPVLSAMFIGAHRGDFVPKMFEEMVDNETDVEKVQTIFYHIRECIMAIYAFVGIPWVVPACLGIVNVLQRKGLENIAAKSFRGPIDPDAMLEKSKEVIGKTYQGVGNNEVRDMLSIGFPEMRRGIAVLVWGYNVGGTVKTGLLERQTELILATAIIASGATRQSRSHIKASLGMGNRLSVVKKVVEMAMHFTQWNQSPVDPLDVDQLAGEIGLA